MTSTASRIHGRSNAKTHIGFIADNGVNITETVHGGGFGAFCKMADRAAAAITGWTTADTRIGFDAAGGKVVTFTNRTTGQVVTAEQFEVIR